MTETTAAPSAASEPAPQESRPQPSGGGEAEGKPSVASPARRLQTFGSSAEGESETEVVAAFHGYLRDVASGNFADVCRMLTDADFQQISEYAAKAGKGVKSCPAFMAELIAPLGQPAREAAAGEIGQIRRKGPDAIVLFTPRGGEPSWFTMTKEDGRWRVISLTAGTPLDPLR